MAATPTTTPAGRTGKLTVSALRLSSPVIMEQDVVDTTWHKAMKIGFIIACFVVPGLIGYVGYRVGASGQPAPVVAPAPVATHWRSYADCQRAYVLTLHQDPEGACDSLPH